MELTDYLAVLRRYWRIWLGVTVGGLLVAMAVLALTPSSYEATARVFVAASPSISNSAQFVNQRAKSYPAVAESQAVLGPVIERLGLDDSISELRTRVSADNPVDTSQVQVTATGTDPVEAAAIANAVAEQMAEVVEELETPRSGDRPVTLTVNDPAAVPLRAAAPVALQLVALGLFAGLFLGLAAAIVRSRLDTRLHSPDDVRRAWGDDIDVLTARRGRAASSALTGRPAATLARRLELVSEGRPLRVAVLSASPADTPAARVLAEDVAAELRRRELPATVTGSGPAGSPGPDDAAAVRLEITDLLAPVRTWHDIASRCHGIVLVVVRGQVDREELREVRGLLARAGLAPLAVVLTGGPALRSGRDEAAPPTQPPTDPELHPAEPSATRRVLPVAAAGPIVATSLPARPPVGANGSSPRTDRPASPHDNGSPRRDG